MDTILKSQGFKVTHFDDIKENNVLLKNKFYSEQSKEKSYEVDFFKPKLNESFEDSNSFLGDLFKGKDVILNENWDKTETIQGKIIHSNETEISIDCLIDFEEKIFELRTFPTYLFGNLSNIDIDKTVLIKTSMKPGSIKLDIFPGDGIVNLNYFKSKENWDSLTDSGLDNKLTKW